MSNSTGPAKQRGCFFYGCLSLAILALVVALFIGVGLYFAKRTMDHVVSNFTETTPAKIEEVAYTEPRMRELRSRVGVFQQGLDKGGDAVELVLAADDLNAFIADTPQWRGRVFVRIEDDQVKGQVSVPLPDIGPLKLKGRYLNGAAAFRVGLDNGRLDVRLAQVTVKDKPLPAVILNELTKRNLADEVNADPVAGGVVGKLESVDVRDGKVVIRSKPATGDGAAKAPGATP